MENIIMPELITPAFKEILASEPELLQQLLCSMDNKEKAVENRDLELDEDCIPKEMKLLFCNVNIRINNSMEQKDEKADSCCDRNTAEQLEWLEESFQEKRMQLCELQAEVNTLKENVLVDEVMLRECERTLKILCKVPLCRKLSSRYKMEIRELQSNLKRKKVLLAERMQLLESARYEECEIEKGIRKNIMSILGRLSENG